MHNPRFFSHFVAYFLLLTNTMAAYEKIDCHSHFVPPEYRKALLENGYDHPDGMPAPPVWSVEKHLEMHKAINVSKSILSITSPGTYLVPGNDTAARNLTRYCNEYAADLKKRHPDTFGSFASLPLPDVEGSLAEIAYAQDVLNADGFTVETNHHGIYLGDPRFDPVFEELNRRNAIVFIHPTSPCMLLDGTPTLAAPLPQWPRPMFEFFFDTARAISNLFLSGTVSRCPNITFIVTHAGGAFPPLINRFSSAAILLKIPGTDPNVTPEFVKERLNSEQFYFDTAGWAIPDQLKGLMQYLSGPQGVERIMYGSDFPWTPLAGVIPLSEDHDRYLKDVFPDPADQEKVCTGNAKRLLALKGRP